MARKKTKPLVESQALKTESISLKQKKLLHILATIIPIAIMGTMFAVQGIYPFGDKQTLVVDSWHQYYPFLSDFWHRIREGTSLRWSWNAGGGHDYIAHIAYYIASPLNVIILLFPHEWLREILNILILLRVG